MAWRYLPPPRRPRTQWIPSAAVAAPTEHFGSAALALTFERVTAGFATKFGASASTYTFTFAVNGAHTAVGRTIGRTLNFNFQTNGVRTAFGTSASTYAFNIAVAGARTLFGTSASTYTLSVATAGTTSKGGSASLTLNANIAVNGFKSTTGSAALPLTFGIATNGFGSGVDTGGAVFNPLLTLLQMMGAPWQLDTSLLPQSDRARSLNGAGERSSGRSTSTRRRLVRS